MKRFQIVAFVMMMSLLAQVAWGASVEDTIVQLSKTIESATSPTEKSTYLVYRGRHYTKLSQHTLAERDYLAALKAKEQGWVWAELAALYTGQKQYVKAAKVIGHIQKNFPQFHDDIANIAATVTAEQEKQYLAENPPEIVFDTKANRKYVSRVQLKNRTMVKAAAAAPPQPKAVYRS
ncbi:hypothetical protein [Desulfosediminicola sp.]|uniref:hypothetical protein n=1 Tax=Desulfosediminicola sp. TaxID=2886825 RepID=UPI003AF24B40